LIVVLWVRQFGVPQRQRESSARCSEFSAPQVRAGPRADGTDVFLVWEIGNSRGEVRSTWTETCFTNTLFTFFKKRVKLRVTAVLSVGAACVVRCVRACSVVHPAMILILLFNHHWFLRRQPAHSVCLRSSSSSACASGPSSFGGVLWCAPVGPRPRDFGPRFPRKFKA
jgi:hypothetical protein